MTSRRQARTSRIQSLALLPVFHRLRGATVLLAGGSDAAAWKAELLLAAGADIRVYAEHIDPELRELIEKNASSFDVYPEEWTPLSFSGAQLAILDTDCDLEAASFLEAGKMSGVPVNVIDNPHFCQFQFGSIVNRSPAIVSISTDGAAPILGQAIRRRIETLLPPALTAWAHLAQAIRPKVNATYKMGAPRRAFWERFVDCAFSGREADEDGLFSAPAQPGRVTLVGAGPGDAELLTIKAMRALQKADVILFDDLVSNEVLELARREAKRMLVGKRGGRTSCRQDDINATMLKLAQSGKEVVRLKGGDPMIFGRAGEEIAYLEAHGIPVDVVPGITAASAMASQLGVTLTHRDCAQSVRFVTGHSRKGELPNDIDWAGIADEATTTVFYMAGRTAERIQEKLLFHGLAPQTPVTIMSSVSRANGKEWHGSLAALREGIVEIGFKDPVLIGVGEVFGKAAAQAASNQPSVAVA